MIAVAQTAWGLGDVLPLGLVAFAAGAAVGFERTRRLAGRLRAERPDRRPRRPWRRSS